MTRVRAHIFTFTFTLTLAPIFVHDRMVTPKTAVLSEEKMLGSNRPAVSSCQSVCTFDLSPS